ILWLECFCF
ncbi:Ribosomal RNA large subunit methyltransferase K/L, partial [Haemophilus influenzae]